MPYIIKSEECIICGSCMVYCKQKAIIVKNKKAFIIREKCNDCLCCVGRCLTRCIVPENK